MPSAPRVRWDLQGAVTHDLGLSPSTVETSLTGTGESDDSQVYRLEDMQFEGPNLDLPSPPPDLPYDRFEDWRSIELLAVNGIPATGEALLEALRTQSNVLLSAAAHASGSNGVKAAIPRLRELTRGPDDYAAVEAAYALARLGEPDGEELLREALQRPLGAYLSPVLAAGYLAQLNDPSGFPVVREALGSDLLATKMLACKQLFFFVPFQGVADGHGSLVDALGLFEQALEDEDSTVQGQALAQLRSMRSAETRPLLENYLGRVESPYLKELAREIVEDLPET
jgi:HEAT repeat protein